jgi:hypothetical protein
MNDSTTGPAAIGPPCLHPFMPPNLTGRNFTRHISVTQLALPRSTAGGSNELRPGGGSNDIARVVHAAFCGRETVRAYAVQAAAVRNLDVGQQPSAAGGAICHLADGPPGRRVEVRVCHGGAFRGIGVRHLPARAMAIRPAPV